MKNNFALSGILLGQKLENTISEFFLDINKIVWIIFLYI